MSAPDNPMHLGRAIAHEKAEKLIRQRLSKELDVDLTPQRLSLDGGAHVDVDGVGPDESVLVEIFAHQGGRREVSAARSWATR